ncbi:uncharacterized protein [Phaseolus vulgaris]|uniref:uncharacterized protein n=1 Tax=Phaseolus vulgaris TaxID=3885 RepID=UPI0035CC5F17
MDKQRRLKLAQILKSKGEASSKGVGDSIPPTSETAPTSPNLRPQHPPTTTSPPALPSPNHPPSSPPPIAAMPLALAETTAVPALLDKGKMVVVVPSEDEDESAEGQVFKRRRTTRASPQAVTSTSSSNHGIDSLRENPPSATSPPQPMALEGGTETEPTSAPPPAPELPPPIQDTLRGYLKKMSPCDQAEGPKKEGMYYYMGAFIACANSWREQAKAKAIEASALQSLEKENASLKEEKETLARRWERQKEAYKVSLKVAQKAKEEASKRLHEAGQAQAELLNQVVPLRVKVVELEDAAKASVAQQKKLEDHCVDREQKLGKTEAALEAKTNDCALLTTENATLQAKVQELVAALATKEQEMASQAENFKATKEKLSEEAATGFADGFAEALVQAACANPGIDVSECSPFNEVVDGKIVPLEASED